jgi:hypothetical protein
MRGLRDVGNVAYGGHDVLSLYPADGKDKPPKSATAAGNDIHRRQLRIDAGNGISHWIQQLQQQAAEI